MQPGTALLGLLALGVIAGARSSRRSGAGPRLAPAALRELAARWGAAWGVPARLLEVVALLESSGRPGMLDNTDPRAVERGGAWGLFGMTLATARSLFDWHRAAFAAFPAAAKWDGTGLSLLDPELNAMLAGFYLAEQWHRFRGSFVATVAAYQQGPETVAKVLARGGNLATDLPPHGREYVQRAIDTFAELEGRAAA
jgi:soluble lytic murein transglycosylase-like protein